MLARIFLQLPSPLGWARTLSELGTAIQSGYDPRRDPLVERKFEEICADALLVLSGLLLRFDSWSGTDSIVSRITRE